LWLLEFVSLCLAYLRADKASETLKHKYKVKEKVFCNHKCVSAMY